MSTIETAKKVKLVRKYLKEKKYRDATVVVLDELEDVLKEAIEDFRNGSEKNFPKSP